MPKNGINQWGWAEMEQLLQCPVCLDIPAIGVVEQCCHGHHICASCKPKVDRCPLCKCDYYGTRNYVVEELIRNFEVLKNTMLLNNIDTDSKPKKTKTKLNDTAKTHIPNVPRRKFNTPDCSKGTFPCRAGDCDVVLPAARLLNHVRTYHVDMLTESEVDYTDSYNQTWEVVYKNKKPINKCVYMIFIKGIGLMFLTLEILCSGQLIVAVQMSSKFNAAQNFMACIELFSPTTTYSYNTRECKDKQLGNSNRRRDATHSPTNGNINNTQESGLNSSGGSSSRQDSTTNSLVTPLEPLPNTHRSQRRTRRHKRNRGVQIV